jgi:MoxR-like ATPase
MAILGPAFGEAVQALANETAEKTVNRLRQIAAPKVIKVALNGAKPKAIQDRVHPQFEKVLQLGGAGVNVLLVGPAGCGKSHLCEQVATALELPFGAISGSAGASEAQLTGRLLPTGEGGRFEYVSSPFVDLYENGGTFLFDELDAFDPNMLLVVNSALANGHIHIEARKASGKDAWVKRHEKSVLLGAANTYGTSGGGTLYVGRSQLDAATLDRWYVVEMTYDRELEEEISDPRLLHWAWALRQKVQDAGLRRVVSTRLLQKGTRALGAGLTLKEVKEDLLRGWTRDEKAKVGEAA